MKHLPRLAPLMLLAWLAGCASNDTLPPAELTEFRSTADIERVWSASMPKPDPRLRLGLGVAAIGEAIVAAGHGGDVVAFNRADGRRLWRTNTRLPLTGGPGAGDNLVVVGSNSGDVVALDATTGEERWKTRINSEILAAPSVARGTVLVRMVDGRLVALRASDGTQLWSLEEEVPRLSLRGTSRPLITGQLAVAGFDNGRVLATQLSDGATVWELTIAPPTGRSELERLVDIDTELMARDNNVYVVTYQGRAASIDVQSGEVLWTRELSSYAGLDLDDTGFYTSTAEGAVVKLGRLDGIEVWRQEALVRRRLSPPSVLGPLVAVADLEGYVHFLDKESGTLAARIRPLSGRVITQPVVVDDMLFMLDVEGRLAALRIKAVGDEASGAVVRGASGVDGGGGGGGRTPATRTPTRTRPGL